MPKKMMVYDPNMAKSVVKSGPQILNHGPVSIIVCWLYLHVRLPYSISTYVYICNIICIYIPIWLVLFSISFLPAALMFFIPQFLFVKNPNSCWLYHGYIIAVEHDPVIPVDPSFVWSCFPNSNGSLGSLFPSY